MDCELRLYKDEIAPGAKVAPHRADGALTSIYIAAGTLRLDIPRVHAAFSANSAFQIGEAYETVGGSGAATVLRWELAKAGPAPALSQAAGVSTSLLLAAPLALDAEAQYLVRCDRVDFPPGGVALLHTHSGGGIRCVIAGSIDIETQGERRAYGPLEAWFESGADPVFAAASATEPTAFVRLMILPRSLLGKSSIAYVNAEDRDRPKSQRYQVFIDAPFELPH